MLGSHRTLVVALVAAALSLAATPEAEADLIYSFKLKNQTGDPAFDYHLAVKGIKAADLKPVSSNVNGKEWAARPVDQAGAAVNFGWSTNKQDPKNPLANGATGTFTFKVNNENKISVVNSQWSDADGAKLGAPTAAPGFVVTKDPDFTFTNDLSDPITFGIQNLRFEANVHEIPPSLLDPDDRASFNPSLPSFMLGPGEASMTFHVPGPLDPGNWDYATGEVVDTSGHVIGAFIFGYTAVPEPGSLALLGAGAFGLAVSSWRRSRTIRRAVGD